MKSGFLLELKNISKSFSGVQALKDVSMWIGYNEIVGLVGDNGAGKSTLIKIISGVYPPDKGEIYWKGNKIDKLTVNKARELGIETVYQERALLPQQTVWRNIFVGRELTGKFSTLKIREMKKIADSILKEFLGLRGIGISSDSIVANLSGGEKQGIAIARALYFKADLIILDEPTVGLSIAETQKVLKFVRNIKEQGKSCIFVTHNIDHVFPVADRFIILDRGRKVLDFPKEDLTRDDLMNIMLKVARGEKVEKIKTSYQ